MKRRRIVWKWLRRLLGLHYPNWPGEGVPIKVPMPKIVCLCGSTRFPEALEEAYLAEVMAGRIPLVFLGSSRKWHDDVELKTQLDRIYFHKVEMADEILVLNVGGYIGYSTRREIDYARALGKKVRWLEHDIPIWKKVLNKARRKLGNG